VKHESVAALGSLDMELIEAASDAIRRRYRYDWQEVGAALRTRSGRVFTGVSLDAYLGRMAVCAEAVALGQAITAVVLSEELPVGPRELGITFDDLAVDRARQ
jgi:cytidine deaminase